MPARVVVVLDDPALADQVADALRYNNVDALAVHDSMEALSALETVSQIELLATSGNFPDWKPNGLALIRMTKLKRPSLKVVFIGAENLRPQLGELGEFLPAPVSPEDIVGAVQRLLGP